MAEDDYYYEKLIAKWVRARIAKRHKDKDRPPRYVRNWCDWMYKICKDSSGEEEVPAPSNVVNWVKNSIDDPDWVDPQG